MREERMNCVIHSGGYDEPTSRYIEEVNIDNANR